MADRVGSDLRLLTKVFRLILGESARLTHRACVRGLVLPQTPLARESRAAVRVRAVKQLQARHRVLFLNRLSV